MAKKIAGRKKGGLTRPNVSGDNSQVEPMFVFFDVDVFLSLRPDESGQFQVGNTKVEGSIDGILVNNQSLALN
jgi:hypothetical protein